MKLRLVRNALLSFGGYSSGYLGRRMGIPAIMIAQSNNGIAGTYRLLSCSHHNDAITTAEGDPFITIRNSLLEKHTTKNGTGISHPSKGTVSWYSCGPTVYESAHIGHARSYVCTDIIRRILTDYFHYDINFAMGITDVDDKIINKAKELGLSSMNDVNQMVRRLESDFFADMDALRVRRPDAVLRVSEHIPEIVDYISQIEQRGFAYCNADGVYFDVNKLGDQYGKLGSVPPSNNAADSVDVDTGSTTSNKLQQQKRDWRDFALWKRRKEEDGPVYWSSSQWGDGRPGWHIECSAMTHSYFGERITIHSGGIDLKFPHHTNEIAQCEAFQSPNQSIEHHTNTDTIDRCCQLDRNWVSVWLHTGHLYIDGRKMSKSLKNFITIKEFLKSDWSTNPIVDFRIMCLQQKYHNSMYFSSDRVKEATLVRGILSNCYDSYMLASNKFNEETNESVIDQQQQQQQKHSVSRKKKVSAESIALRQSVGTAKLAITKALQNDFDTPVVLSELSQLATKVQKYCTLYLNQVQIHSSRTDAHSSSSTIDPIAFEPVLSAMTLIDNMLTIFGFKLSDFAMNIKDATDQSAGNSAGSSLDINSINILTEFRQEIRQISVEGMKTISKQSKALNAAAVVAAGTVSGTSNDLPTMVKTLDEAGKAPLKAILTKCDQVREDVAKKLNIKIEDGPAVSTWKRI